MILVPPGTPRTTPLLPEPTLFRAEDPCTGLADAALMAGPAGDLDLDHPWAIDADAAVDLARACEAAAFAADPRITGSEGAGVSSHRGISAYANTPGFFSARRGTRHRDRKRGVSGTSVAGRVDLGVRRFIKK